METSKPPSRPVPRGRRTVADLGSQGGFSLIEIIVSVLLISLVVLGLASAFLAITRTNAATAERQVVDQAIGSYGESLKTLEYLPCDGPTPGTAAAYDALFAAQPAGGWTPPTGMTARVADVEHWDATGRAYVSGCATDQGGQRLTIEVSWRDTDRTAQIVKRVR